MPRRTRHHALLDQYLVDVHERGYADARLKPHGKLTPEEVERWTRAEK